MPEMSLDDCITWHKIRLEFDLEEVKYIIPKFKSKSWDIYPNYGNYIVNSRKYQMEGLLCITLMKNA